MLHVLSLQTTYGRGKMIVSEIYSQKGGINPSIATHNGKIWQERERDARFGIGIENTMP